MLKDVSSLELSLNLIPYFSMFFVSAYLSYKLINQRNSYVNAIGIAWTSAILIFASAITTFNVFPIISMYLKQQNKSNIFNQNFALVTTTAMFLLVFLTIYICKLREKNDTTILFYGLNPTYKEEFVKNAIENLSWKDYEITKEYHRGGRYGRNISGKGNTIQELNVSRSRGIYSPNAVVSYRSIEETIVKTKSKKIFIRGNRNLYIKLVSNDVKKDYIDGFELDEYKLAFKKAFADSNPYVIQGKMMFWLFTLVSIGILFLILNKSLLNEQMFDHLVIYMTIIFGLGNAFLYYDSDKMPSNKVKR
ncbi:MAG: hypothetical protein KAH01_00920 [Caldisericia bacterium]|nr:hypothetical protein [Caldisericia bacterium]